jgi:hypothetical protein
MLCVVESFFVIDGAFVCQQQNSNATNKQTRTNFSALELDELRMFEPSTRAINNQNNNDKARGGVTSHSTPPINVDEIRVPYALGLGQQLKEIHAHAV